MSSGLCSKNSILHRPIKNDSRITVQSIDDEYTRSQQRLEARKQRKEQLRETLSKHFFSTKEEKKEIQQEMRAAIGAHLETRQAAHQAELEAEFRQHEVMRKQREQTEQMDAELVRARKEYLANLLSENKRLMEYREEQAKQRQIKEIREEQMRPDFYRNYGKQPF